MFEHRKHIYICAFVNKRENASALHARTQRRGGLEPGKRRTPRFPIIFPYYSSPTSADARKRVCVFDLCVRTANTMGGTECGPGGLIVPVVVWLTEKFTII